jgi:hypothetical protein
MEYGQMSMESPCGSNFLTGFLTNVFSLFNLSYTLLSEQSSISTVPAIISLQLKTIQGLRACLKW